MFHSGQVVRTLRRARGWTQKALAQRAGVSDMTISKMERSATNYRRGTLEAVAAALDTTPESLIAPPPSSASPSSTTLTSAEDDRLMTRLLTLWAALEPEHREAGLEALEIAVSWSIEVQQLRLQVKAVLNEARTTDAERYRDVARFDALDRARRTALAEAVRARTAGRPAAAAPPAPTSRRRRRVR